MVCPECGERNPEGAVRYVKCGTSSAAFDHMKKALSICALLVLVAGEAGGCPVCVYQRLMPTWKVFVALRVFAVCIIAGAVLNEMRVLGVFFVYEVVYYSLWWLAIEYIYLDLVEFLVPAFFLILSLGIPAVLVLKFVGRFKWFRREPDRGVSWKRALLIIPAMVLVYIAEGIITAGL
jgi:hypothetical protein